MAYREQPAAISRDKATFTLDTHIAWKQAVSTSSPKWNNALLCLHFLPRDATYISLAYAVIRCLSVSVFMALWDSPGGSTVQWTRLNYGARFAVVGTFTCVNVNVGSQSRLSKLLSSIPGAPLQLLSYKGSAATNYR